MDAARWESLIKVVRAGSHKKALRELRTQDHIVQALRGPPTSIRTASNLLDALATFATLSLKYQADDKAKEADEARIALARRQADKTDRKARRIRHRYDRLKEEVKNLGPQVTQKRQRKQPVRYV